MFVLQYAALNGHNAYEKIILGYEFYRSVLKHTHEELVYLQDAEHGHIFEQLGHAVNYGLDISIPVLVIIFQLIAVRCHISLRAYCE